MYAVIFTATINAFDDDYPATAERMRELAMSRYGCRDFVAVTEGDTEIAVSYWDSEDQIRQWKQDPQHLAAQQKGRSRWYKSYKVEVVEVTRRYTSGAGKKTPA